jgi:hypothetical protein
MAGRSTQSLAVMRGAVAIGIIGACCVPAHAKCVEAPYLVTGHVAAADGRPIANAGIAVSWSDILGGQVARAISGRDGSYNVEFRASTYSGQRLLGGDACEHRITSAAVDVISEAYRPAHVMVKLENGHAESQIILQPVGR